MKERNQVKMRVIELYLCFCLSSLFYSLILREKLSKFITHLSSTLLEKVMNCFNCGYCFMGNFYWVFKLQLRVLTLPLKGMNKTTSAFQVL